MVSAPNNHMSLDVLEEITSRSPILLSSTHASSIWGVQRTDRLASATQDTTEGRNSLNTSIKVPKMSASNRQDRGIASYQGGN